MNFSISPVPHSKSVGNNLPEKKRAGHCRRTTLGFLGGPLTAEELAPGVIDATKCHDVDLIIFAGGMIEGPLPSDASRDIIPNLIGSECIDGLFINTDYLGHAIGSERMKAFCAQYSPLPMVKSELPIPNIPTVEMDFYQGMAALVEHLIDVHHYQKIAFIQSPTHSVTGMERFRAYKDTLKNHSIPIDEMLIAPGTLFAPSGVEAIQLFLDKRRLRPHIDLEAIVCVNDYTAIDVLSELDVRGIKVPEDIAVVGFDDLEVSCSTSPALTSVYLPTYEVGYWGIATLLTLITGGEVEESIHLPTTPVLRQSCGCQNKIIHKDEVDFDDTGIVTEKVNIWLDSNREKIINDITSGINISEFAQIKQDVPDVVNAAVDSLYGSNNDRFIESIQQALAGPTGRKASHHITLWYNLLLKLRQFLSPYCIDSQSRIRLESLCYKGSLLLGQIVQQLYVHRLSIIADLGASLRQMHSELAATMDIDAICDVLARRLPQLGIPSCYLSLFEQNEFSVQSTRLVLAFDQHGRIDLGDQGMITNPREIIPERLRDRKNRHTYIVEPLSFGDEQFGFIVMENQADYLALYEDIREQISNTLQRVNLHRKAVTARHTAEEADRLKSRFLSVVSHELRTPLNMIVALSELLLQEDSPTSPTPYRNEIEVIHTTGQHLNRLVRDVLDLGRSQLGQLALTNELLDLAEVLQDILPFGERMVREKGLQWKVKLPSSLPFVWGDSSRLRQVIMNLLSNACKFTNQGSVSLEAFIDDGIVQISVIDTGIGIPVAEQETIFDEFRQSERSTKRGYGGMGLGLAITKKLVELHGGTLRVTSTGEEGSGARFSFSLPIVARHMQTITPDLVNWEGVVLIVSRSKDGSNPVQQYLSNRGFNTVSITVEDSDQWLTQVRIAKPGAIILDCQTSLDWGIRLMHTIQEDETTSGIPVLLYHLSKEADTGAVLDIQSLPKPLNAELLIKALTERNLLDDTKSQEGKTVLLVDDDPPILRLHTKCLHELLPTAHIMTALNGHAALQCIEDKTPDLILLDLMMPEMDGLEVLRELRSRPHTRSIPVIILTAYTITEKVLEQLNTGVAAILNKGMFSTDETLEHIASVLMNNKRLGTESQRIARQAMVFIHEHYQESVTRADITDHINVSERYLTRCFHDEFGITPITYLNRYRVTHALKLLKETDLAMTQIALRVGFSSSSYFSRIFKRETGMSPTSFAKSPSQNRI